MNIKNRIAATLVATLAMTGGTLIAPLTAASAAPVATRDIVLTWGFNGQGQLGDGTTTQRTTPVPVDFRAVGNPEIGAVAGGAHHSLALAADGSVYAWGDNGEGRLGDGTTTQRTTPVMVDFSDVGNPEITSVAAGYGHSLALASDGSVYAWGRNNDYGQLGDGTTTDRHTPVKVDFGDAGNPEITAIAAGKNHSLALASDGSAYAWGDNGGQLGDGTTTDRHTPVKVDFSDAGDPKIVDVAGGANHSLAMASDGSVFAWGDNGQGRLGDGTTTRRTTPVPVDFSAFETITIGDHVIETEPPKVVGIAGGDAYSLGVDAKGSAYTWGRNEYGQLGDRTTTNRHTPVEVEFSGNPDIVAVAGGFEHGLALDGEGSAYAWGRNQHGQLGDSTTAQRTAPVRVDFGDVGNPQILGVAGGNNHSLAIARVSDTDTFVEITDVAVDGNEITVTGTGEPGAEVEVALDGQTETTTVDANGDWTVTFTGVSDGTHTVRVDATDSVGNQAQDTAPVTVDTARPRPPTPAPTPDVDTDRDGLTDAQERNGVRAATTVEGVRHVKIYRSNPLTADSDGDGLRDGDEVRGWQVKLGQKTYGHRTYRVTSDPLRADADRDGLRDGAEARHRTNPWDPDTDGQVKSARRTGRTIGRLEGLGDAREVRIRTSPVVRDTDRDGRTDHDEVKGRTAKGWPKRTFPKSNPLKRDTDGDGIKDSRDRFPRNPRRA